jgi:hypothetical protein
MKPVVIPVWVALFCVPAAALAHVERPAYWPDPASDTSVKPATGGKVPKIRTLSSSLKKSKTSKTRVVCQSDSLTLLKKAVRNARTNGYEIRPSDKRKLSKKQGRWLVRVNTKLFKRCRYKEIQPAVTASGNNDRVVIMPGLYLEPTARAQPTHDPACADLKVHGDRPGEGADALSYAYQVKCPNDQNLVAVIGRALGTGEEPKKPRENRHGIPNAGACIRCNLQIEGSGVSADDVVVDAGDETKGNGGPNGIGAKKDVVFRADRADGFVLRNVTVRHAGEHGIYVLESDGYVLDRFKAFFNKLYGTLTFVEDHGVQQNCEAVGHGDSGIYPGAAVETGVQREPGTRARLNQEIRFCDLHGNLAGYSGTNGNAVWVHHNEIYDNALGLQTDVVTGAGHPGYPGDSMVVEDNNFHTNNFNPYSKDSPVIPSFPFPVGTGMWIAGGNHHTVRFNRFWDNWRRGAMLFSVPDSLVCGPAADGNEQAGCDSSKVSTSHYNSFYDNVMGQQPGGKTDRNGTDFWWDQMSGSRGNCWYRNTGPKPITTDPTPLPDCDDGKDPSMSLGTGNPKNESELGGCAAAFFTRNFEQPSPCAWLSPPSDPGDGDAAMGGGGGTGLTGFPAARASAKPRDANVPLGQMSCADWNAAQSDLQRQRLIERVRAFAGGVVVTGDAAVGTGATMTNEGAAGTYDTWCGYGFAQGFLLYKLYTWSAAFQNRGQG